MNKAIFLIFLFSSTCINAQDRIITIKSDTLTAKITSLDKQKVVYYLAEDKDKKIEELFVSDLHKIVWRSGLEYVINSELEKNLKEEAIKEVTVNNITPIENLSITKEKELLAFDTHIANAPELRVRRYILWRTYTADGKRVHRDVQEKILEDYDNESYNYYTNGNGFVKEGLKTARISFAVRILSPILLPISPYLGIGVYLAAYGVGIGADMKKMKGNKLMRKAVLNYEDKRVNKKLKPKFSNIGSAQ